MTTQFDVDSVLCTEYLMHDGQTYSVHKGGKCIYKPTDCRLGAQKSLIQPGQQVKPDE